jgi:hypothetical protein
MDAKTEFDRIFGDVVMSDNDAAWYIFKAGWNAARQSGSYPHAINCECITCFNLRESKKNSDRRKRREREIED